MKTLNIITVGYNEEVNLPKLFRSLDYIKTKIECRIIYIDQSSQDKSVKIAKNYSIETYVHENRGYPEPDKKWAVETLLEDGQWCLFLDSDEELSLELSNEIIDKLTNDNNKFTIYDLGLDTYFLGIVSSTVYQTRLFKKNSIIITDEIHKYLKVPEGVKIGKIRNKIINDNLNERDDVIFKTLNKHNRYSQKELEKYDDMSFMRIRINMIIVPIIWFFGMGIVHKQFLRGYPGFINCIIMGFYQFTIFAKLYEKKLKKNG